MVARSSALFSAASFSMTVVATIGALTAVFAATIALVQNDIKRVVAYSTISQLGYMFLGAGVGAYASAIFHLATHAFFKALLFLGSGSVIHALGGEQDIRRMGQLKEKLPITSRTFYWASLANAGVIPLAGFWSKDEILAATFLGHHYVLWALASAGAFMTAFYMFRLYYTVFEGKDNVPHDVAHHVHESPPVMAYPLMTLGVCTLVVGVLFGFPPDHGLYHRFVEPVFAAAGAEPHAASAAILTGLGAIATVIAALGIWGLARSWYKTGDSPAPGQAAERFRGLYTLVLNKYWVDEVYNAVFVDFGRRLCRLFWTFDAEGVDGTVNGTSRLTVALSQISAKFDFHGVDGLVNRIAYLIQGGSQVFRRLQTGVIQNYILAMAMGIIVIVTVYIFVP